MDSNADTPARRAAAEPETSFQALTRELGLTFHAPLPAPIPLAPVIEELLALIDTVPDVERGHHCYDGSWSAVTLILPTADRVGEPTPLMARTPRLQALFDTFGGKVSAAFIARIAPGDLLDWHYDPVSADVAETRLHLVMKSDPGAVTDFCHERAHWPAGTLNYGDYGFPHRVLSTGVEERIHLYFDVPSETVRPHLPAELLTTRHQIRQEATGRMLLARSEITSPA